MMNKMKFSQKQYGFSMIEVMISIVVLGFGLLALAALQTSVIRSSSETKAQTIALQLAKDKIEDLRSFQELAGYQALDSGNDSAGTLSGVAFTRSWVVSRFAYNSAGAVVSVVPNVGTITTAGTYVADNEYKTVAVTVSWTDANGVAQSVRLDDAIGALAPSDGSKVVLNNTSSTQQRYPRILIFDPSSTPGVIPIVVTSSGDATAATNPKPEVAGSNNNQRVVETRYDILTYAAPSNGNAQVQSRVETAVIGCTCNKGNAVSTDTAYRPSYWNGFRYTVPKVAEYAPIAGAATIPNNAPPQSQYCTSCCRDHHDPAGTLTAKFDPRRNTHDHYKIVNGALVAAGANDDYLESCRLIRVDGIFRVAADLYNDYFNLLETKNDNTSLAYTPTSAATLNYQNIVLDYLGQRIINQGTSALYNNLLSSTSLTALETSRNINAPQSININRSNDFKWLHSRGLFIDYLEPEAIDKITEVKTKCSVNSTLQTCVLPYVPFTSINLSELSNWSPLSGQQLVVTNADFSQSISQVDPVRGKVVPGSNPTNGTTQTAYANLYSSNSGVAVMPNNIDPDETSLQDSQAFAIQGSSQNNGGVYTAIFSNYTFGSSTAAYPTLTPSPTAVCNFATTGGSRPNPYTCTSSSIGVGVLLTVSRYNYEDKSGTSTAAFPSSGVDATSGNTPCTGPVGNKAYNPGNGDKYAVTYCKNYSVSSVNLMGVIGAASPSDGAVNETTTISFPLISSNDAINIDMTYQGQTKTKNTCTYTCSSPTCSTTGGNKITFSVSSDPCQ